MLLLLLLCLSERMNFGFYSYGLQPVFGDYKNVSLFVQKEHAQFNLSLNLSKNRDRTINSIYTEFPVDALGFIRIGYTRLNVGKLTTLPRDYIGLDFFNPEFSFGLFKRYDRNNSNLFTLRTSLTKNARYDKLLITKDDTSRTFLNFVSGYNTKALQLEGAVSLSKYLSFALYGRKNIRGERTSLSIALSKYFKNFYSGARLIPPLLSINASFSLKLYENLYYSNQANFSDRSGNKNIMFYNSLVYTNPRFGVFNLLYRYTGSSIPEFAYMKNFGSVSFDFSIAPNRRNYSFLLKRKPLVIKLSKYIIDSEEMSRIFSSVDYGRFSFSLEYFVSNSKQYIVSTSMFKYRGLNVFQNVYYYTSDSTHNMRFTSGINIFSPLRIPSLSTIKGRVYFDKNANGVYDKEDTPLDSIKVILDGEKLTYTNEEGNFNFKYVSKGHHRVRLDLGLMPAEFGSTEGDVREVTTGFMETKYIEFKVASLGEVKGRVFVDNNVNGVFDDHDLPLEGCIVSINGKRTWTWEGGIYRFSNVPPGSYRIKVEYCPEKIIPVNKDFYDIYVMPGDKISGLDFPFIQGEEIKVKVKEF